MTKTMERLYDAANENFNLKGNKEYTSLQKEFSRDEKAFCIDLTPEQREDLEQLFTQRADLTGHEEAYFFSEGFRMAVELLAAAIVKK